MPDKSILWLSAAGPFWREMLERAEGYQVYARYPWDPPSAPSRAQPDSNTSLSGLRPASASPNQNVWPICPLRDARSWLKTCLWPEALSEDTDGIALKGIPAQD